MNAASDWVATHADAATGQPAADVAGAVTRAGLRSRTAGPDAILTLEFRPDRVTIETDAEGRVLQVRAG